MEPQKLTSDVARELIDPRHQRYLSPISIWELLVLCEKNRMRLDQDFPEWFKKSTTDLEILEAPFHWQVAQELRLVHLQHKDPADRFLVATARIYDMTLVTADKKLMNVDGLNVLPNH